MIHVHNVASYQRSAKPEDRLAVHEYRVQFLNTLAMLLGCKETFGTEFPDGKRPDVLRVDSKGGVLFIGDAKNTESPKCQATQARLLEYLSWLSAHVSRDGRVGIFAICFGRDSDTQGWKETICSLAHQVSLVFSDHGVEKFEPEINVAWFLSRI